MGLFDDAKQLFDEAAGSVQDSLNIDDITGQVNELGEEATHLLESMQLPDVNVDDIIADVVDQGGK